MRGQRQEVEKASQLQSQRLGEVNKASLTAEACLQEFVAQASRDAQFSRALVWAALAVAGVVFRHHPHLCAKSESSLRSPMPLTRSWNPN